MRRLLIIIAALVVLVSVDVVHASVIDVFSIRQSFRIQPEIGARDYSIHFLLDNPIPFFEGAQFNGATKFETGYAYRYLVDMLQRTFEWEEGDTIGDMPFPEAISYYGINRLCGTLWVSDFPSCYWRWDGIPDLSKYTINSLYAYDFTSFTGDMVDMDIRIVADVTSVPEPSSFLLLALGAAGVFLANRLRFGTKR